MDCKIVLVGSESMFREVYPYFISIRAREIIEDTLANVLPGSLSDALEQTHRVLIASGLLMQASTLEKTAEEKAESLKVNLSFPIALVELLISHFPKIDIIVLGSESGLKGSYDTEYALSKSALAMYVKEKKVGVHQKLNLLSPSLVLDSPMTSRRTDLSSLNAAHLPKSRFLSAVEVWQVAEWMFQSSDYLCNAVITLDGGKFARWD